MEKLSLEVKVVTLTRWKTSSSPWNSAGFSLINTIFNPQSDQWYESLTHFSFWSYIWVDFIDIMWQQRCFQFVKSMCFTFLCSSSSSSSVLTRGRSVWPRCRFLKVSFRLIRSNTLKLKLVSLFSYFSPHRDFWCQNSGDEFLIRKQRIWSRVCSFSNPK